MSFPECYEDFIAKAHYARFLDEEERRENWDEIVERYLNFIFDHINENNNPGWEGAEEGQLYNELYRAIYNKEVFPSMRGLWSAGPALKRDHVALYNPVAGDTLVLTYEKGLTPISELEGEDFTVLNVRGDWASATFRGYGEQETVEVNLRLNSNTKKTVRATLNHRWVLQDGRVVSTKDLKRGDRISFVAPRRPSMDNLDYDLGIIHGLVYGDGVATYSQERVNGYLLRICKDVEDILPYLDKYPVAYPPSMGGDPVVMIYDPFAKTHSLKSLPPSEETDEYLLGFMRGWLAADGSVTATSQVSLAAGEEEIEWINNVASRIGFVIQNTYCYPNKTNFGYRKKNLFCISFSRSCMVPEDFIIERKRDNFKSLESHYVFCDFGDRYMKNVYCAEVPDTNTFVLDQGLVTGNCAYVPIDSINSFEEMIYMLACGTGVGFSVEEQYISKLFKVPRHFNNSGVVSAHIVVEDSKYGWAQSYGEFLYYLYRGAIPSWDIGYLRPRGARLKVFGGRSSGPEALQELFEFTIKIFMGARGRKLSALECHDLACKVGEVILSGGVRRAALISLQDLNDDDLRYAKSGEWWKEHPHRALSNNSAVYDGIPSRDVFDKEWAALVNSGSGERGIFNKRAALNQVNKTKRRNNNYEFRVNPCSEILLRPNEFCNLSTLVVRPEDTADILDNKIRLATILGTFQSTFVDFKLLRSDWKRNAVEERLLGVSMTGMFGNELMSGKKGFFELRSTLRSLKEAAKYTNFYWADRLGINRSAAITAVKPEGTSSQLAGVSSGLHPWHSEYFIRTVRIDKKDPIADFLVAHGVPCEEDVMAPDHRYVFSFPVKSPDGAILRDNLSAIEHLNIWKVYQDEYCEHKPSATISVKAEEWREVGDWVYNNFEDISGISFLPYSDHTYAQAPYQEITREEYEELIDNFPCDVNFNSLKYYEKGDDTVGAKTLACSGDSCELVDVVK